MFIGLSDGCALHRFDNAKIGGDTGEIKRIL